MTAKTITVKFVDVTHTVKTTRKVSAAWRLVFPDGKVSNANGSEFSLSRSIYLANKAAQSAAASSKSIIGLMHRGSPKIEVVSI